MNKEIKRLQKLAGLLKEEEEDFNVEAPPEWNEIEVVSFDVFFVQIGDYYDENDKIALFANYGGIDGIKVETKEYLGVDDDDNDIYEDNKIIVTLNNLSNLYDYISWNDDLEEEIINSFYTGEWIYKEEGFNTENYNHNSEDSTWEITSITDENGTKYKIKSEDEIINNLKKTFLD